MPRAKKSSAKPASKKSATSRRSPRVRRASNTTQTSSITRRIVKEPAWLWLIIGILVLFIVWYIWAWLNPGVTDIPSM